jgi:deazaflavin-dependent oxidoreductase (nitroreductase family)
MREPADHFQKGTIIMSTAAPPANQRLNGSVLVATRLFNRVVLRLAGTRVLPLYGVLQHRGRRSGKTFRTPVVVRPTVDGFVVPMPWGERTDWYRNVRAAGECMIRWKGRDYMLAQPEVIDVAAARDAFSGVQLRLMPRLGITRCLRLRRQA